MATTELLSKREYGFLEAARYKSKNGPYDGKLSSYLVKDGYVLTTTGFTIHAIPTKLDSEGYYMWNSAMDQLVKVDDSVFPGGGIKDGIHKSFLSFQNQLAAIDPLNIISFPFGVKTYGLPALDQIVSIKSGRALPIGFIKSSYWDELASICIGISCVPLKAAPDIVGLDESLGPKTIFFDVRLLKPVQKYMANYRMRWNGTKQHAIFENGEGWKAIVMPIHMGGNSGEGRTSSAG